MLKLKLQYFGHLMWRTDSLEKTLMLGRTEERRGRQWMRWLDGITNSVDKFDQALGVGDGQGSLACCSPWGLRVKTRVSDWTDACHEASLMAQMVKNLPAMQETQIWSLGGEDTLEKEMATHSSILAWRIPWTQEPGGLLGQSFPKSQTWLSNWAHTHAFWARIQVYFLKTTGYTFFEVVGSSFDQGPLLAFILNTKNTLTWHKILLFSVILP